VGKWPGLFLGYLLREIIDGERIRCDHTCICDAAGTLKSCPQTEPSALGPATHRSARARDGSQR
jgi:hypothetical protein